MIKHNLKDLSELFKKQVMKENTYSTCELLIKANLQEKKAQSVGMRFNKELYIKYLIAQMS
jgi:uncharacterized protein YqgQ